MMKKILLLTIITLPLIIISCGYYPDGTYCADVDAYNPNTGKSSNYTLNVEIEEYDLITIY